MPTSRAAAGPTTTSPADETDPDLLRFDSSRDDAWTRPLLRRAAALQPRLSVLATPWSAPAWTKTSGSVARTGRRRPRGPRLRPRLGRRRTPERHAAGPLEQQGVPRRGLPLLRRAARWPAGRRRCVPHARGLHDECSGGDWATDFASNLAWNAHHLVIGNLRTNGSSLLLWNLVLDPSSGPTNGGCSNCRGVVTADPATGGVRYGVGRVESVAFRHPDGTTAVLLRDDGASKRSATAVHAGEVLPVTLPGGAVQTLLW